MTSTGYRSPLPSRCFQNRLKKCHKGCRCVCGLCVCVYVCVCGLCVYVICVCVCLSVVSLCNLCMSTCVSSVYMCDMSVFVCLVYVYLSVCISMCVCACISHRRQRGGEKSPNSSLTAEIDSSALAEPPPASPPCAERARCVMGERLNTLVHWGMNHRSCLMSVGE